MTFPRALLDADELQLTTVGRKTGRESSRPVWFVHDDQTLYLLAGLGDKSQWYRNILHRSRIRLSADGTSQTATATPVRAPDRVAAIVDAFREKYGAGQIAAFYPALDVAVEVHAEGE